VPRAAIAVGAGVLAAAILAGVQLSALAAVTAGIRTGDAGNFAAATADFLAALRADPWDETAALDLGQVEWGLTSRTHQLALQRQYAAEAQGSFTRALALDPYDYTARLDYANFLDAQGRDGAGVAQLRAALADAPYVASVYDALAIGLVRAAVPKITSGHAALARPYLAAVPAVAAELKARSAAVPGPALAAVKTGQNAAFPPTSGGVTLALGEADAMENHLSQAAAVLRPLANQPGQLGAEANLWLGAIDQRQGALPASGRALGLAQSGLGSAYAAELQAVNATIGKAG
jgi:tetratricopeptide (TPR) repeat protein